MADSLTGVELPTDRTGHVIQAMSITVSTNANGTVAAASARFAVPAGAVMVRLAATTDCYIEWGTSSVNAGTSDPVFPVGVEYMRVPDGATHLAFERVTADGIISITEAV